MKIIELTKVFLNVIVGSSLIALFCCSGSKQVMVKKEVNYIPYYLKVYEADSLYWTGNYERSFEILDSLFKMYEPLNQIETRELQTYLTVAYLIEHYEVLKPAIKKLVTVWDYRYEYVEYDSLMSEIWETANINKKEITQWEQECKNKINRTLKDTIILMTKNDQLYRGKDRKKEDSIDISHKNLLKYIFEKYDYPDFRLVGYPKYGEMTDLGIIYLHIFNQLDENEYTYFQEKLLEYIKEGTASPRYLANLVDRANFIYKHTTIYGTYGTHESWGDEMVKFDTVEINKNRKSIGLPSIEYQQFKWKQSSMNNQ